MALCLILPGAATNLLDIRAVVLEAWTSENISPSMFAVDIRDALGICMLVIGLTT